VNNNYASKPQAGKKRLDTNYYLHFVLTWH
jgi:hypothetical protein